MCEGSAILFENLILFIRNHRANRKTLPRNAFERAKKINIGKCNRARYETARKHCLKCRPLFATVEDDDSIVLCILFRLLLKQPRECRKSELLLAHKANLFSPTLFSACVLVFRSPLCNYTISLSRTRTNEYWLYCISK